MKNSKRPQLLKWGVGALGLLSLGGGLVFVGTTLRGAPEAATTASVAASTTTTSSDPRMLLAMMTSADQIAPIERLTQELELRRNETVVDVLTRAGVSREDTNGVVAIAAQYVDLRYMQPGEGVTAFTETDPASGAVRLTGLSLRPEAERQVLISRGADGAWEGRELMADMAQGVATVKGDITTSIYESAIAQGASDQQVVDFATIFGYDVDFQREIWPGDKFEITYETFRDERGRPVKNGNVLYAELDGQALHKSFYRFTAPDDGVTEYYDSEGQSMKKFLMKTPINGARLSSGFGNRKHPILGYTKLHKGTDFAAPTGTPIYAAGNGVIERAGPFSTFGNYVKIQHANGYETAYAHMSRFGKGIRAGVRVKQGDVIGYVGTTGQSTGPHLHYEVYVKNTPVNAMGLKLPTGRKLAGSVLEAFTAEKTRIDALRAGKDTAPVLVAEGAEPDLRGRQPVAASVQDTRPVDMYAPN